MPLFQKPYTHASDEELMQKIQRGKIAAFDELYARYSHQLLRYFHRMLGGNQDNAQDFLQDLFFKVVENPGRFHTQNRFSTWIFTVAHNMCKNEYRRRDIRKTVSSIPNPDILPSPESETGIDRRLDQQAFKKALLEELAKLAPNQRTTFLLRHQEDRSIKEISAILNCSEGTTKSRLFYATQKLAQRLKPLHPNQEEG